VRVYGDIGGGMVIHRIIVSCIYIILCVCILSLSYIMLVHYHYYTNFDNTYVFDVEEVLLYQL
jgi:hypothetical protein